MPQVYAIIDRSLVSCFDKETFAALKKEITPIIESKFGIEGHDDVVLTAVSALYAEGEALIQIEIRYTAGTDEYNWGKPFDPSIEVQKDLADVLELAIFAFCLHRKLPKVTVSVWCKPYYNGFFKMYEK